MEVSVSGTGSWKCLTVTNVDTGEVIEEKKFHKPKFDQIMSSPQYKDYIDDLIEVVMIKKFIPEGASVDKDSYIEVESLSNSISEDFIDPEA